MRNVSTRTYKAVKPHKCYFCQQEIKKGTTYTVQTNSYDGEIFSLKHHQECNTLAIKLKMYDNCDEGLSCYEFAENIFEEYNEIQFKLHKSEHDIYITTKVPFKDALQVVMEHHKIPFQHSC